MFMLFQDVMRAWTKEKPVKERHIQDNTPCKGILSKPCGSEVSFEVSQKFRQITFIRQTQRDVIPWEEGGGLSNPKNIFFKTAQTDYR